ncbi:unnamed protein product [Amoebophrya sp. A25]|nr:unnamed protein product [Amoebophrya sp. A25]|eukprot:GSA25T00023012001.1
MASFGSGAQYGSTPSEETERVAPAADMRKKYGKMSIDKGSLLLVLLLPPGIFTGVLYVTAFRLAHDMPRVANTILFWVAFFYLWHLSFVGYKLWRGQLTAKKWHALFGLGLTAALGAGAIIGREIIWYTYNDLVDYVLIDPANAHGQTYMDSGTVYFKQGTRVASETARAFKDSKIYCVAPIVGQPLQGVGSRIVLPSSGTVDFWAVGTDCCQASGDKFACGEVSNGLAKSGMRLIKDEERAFYRLAVEEWSNEFGLQAKHPLFFTWVQDPVSEINALYTQMDSQSSSAEGIYCYGENSHGSRSLLSTTTPSPQTHTGTHTHTSAKTILLCGLIVLRFPRLSCLPGIRLGIRFCAVSSTRRARRCGD